MWRSYASATALSTAKNYIMQSDSAFTHAINGVDQVFDITEALSQAAPRDNLLLTEYNPMSTMRTQMEKRVQPSPPLSLSWY